MESNNLGTSVSSKGNGFSTATERGTKIVKENAIDKNSFLKILTAQLTHQDPFNTQDSSQFVAQLAQFSQIEQMTNLTSTMTEYNAYSLIGKTVAFKQYDLKGNQYGGVIENVFKDNNTMVAQVNIYENGGYVKKKFNVDDISEVINNYGPDFELNNNMNFLMSSSLIGKSVEVSNNGKLLAAEVNSVYKEGILINLNVSVKGEYVKGEMKLDTGYNSESPQYTGIYKGSKDGELQLKYNKEKDNYKYRILMDGEKPDDIEWLECNSISNTEDMKFKLPEKKSTNDTIWKASLKAVELGEKNVASESVLVIKK